MFISNALASSQDKVDSIGALIQFAPLILIFIVFYFLLIRPQQKKQKEHKRMLEAIRRGDKIVTSGGLIGIVSQIIDENEILLEITDGIEVRVLRHMVSQMLLKKDKESEKKHKKN